MIRDQHIPIMTNEILSFINRKKNLSILDCTFGGGGHSKKFLENGHNVTAIDQDDNCLLYTSPSPRDSSPSRMPSSA